MRDAKSLAYGTAAAVIAYAIWGLFPIYWKWLQDVPPLQLVCHRIVWTCVTLCAVIALSGQWRSCVAAFRTPGAMRIYLAAAVLMGVNWLVFLLAVDSGQITQTGLGYFMSPLVNVFMGVVLLHERLRAWQWFSVGLATMGVLYLTVSHGSLPWMALALAFSFGTYGLVKKVAALGALPGLMLETTILLPGALAYLVYCDLVGQGAFAREDALSSWLMVGTGLISMTPLLLFAFAAQRIPLARLGFLQYLTPTMQLLLGTLLYREPFGYHSLIGFGMVWVALLAFGVEGFVARPARQKGGSALP
jgi:chloramphenicol-sensitive protein RarD